MIKEIVTDEAILSKTCEPATAADADVAQDLLDTIATIDDAACLHANQIGVCKSVFVYLDEADKPHVIYNPVLKLGLHAQKTEEGCLSRQDMSLVTRYERVKVAYETMGKDGRLVSYTSDFKGWMAQIVQHMIDHSKGKLV